MKKENDFVNHFIPLCIGAVSMPFGKDQRWPTKQLVQWYQRFGFKCDPGMVRKPENGQQRSESI
jgi:hypothetical protein